MEAIKNDFSKMVIQKRWTVNGAITPQARDSYYFIDTTEGNAKIVELLTTVPRSYVMMHGPRGAGKTTRVFQLCEQLQNDHGYTCAVVSLQEGVPFDTTAGFWGALGPLIHRHLNHSPKDKESAIRDSKTFVRFFSTEPFVSCKVVLVVDEFDLLHQAEAPVKDDFLHALRAMRQNKDHPHGLHAFIAVGPFSILKLRNLKSSPFNVSDAYPVPRFKRHDVREILGQYITHTKVKVAKEIPDAIYDLTNGHPGLVSFCGKRISEVLAKGRTEVSYDSWVHYAATKLVPELRTSWATMATLVDGIRSEDAESKQAREYLVDNFLLQDPAPLSFPEEQEDDAETEGEDNTPDWGLPVVDASSENDIRHCGFLASEGILREVSTNRFTLASFLVRNLVTWAIRSTMSSPDVYFDAIPRKKLGCHDLDMPRLVTGCVKAFNKKRMEEAPTRTSKTPRRSPRLYDSVPSEACYHHELFHALAGWLDRDYNVANEVNAPMSRPGKARRPARQRCDLLVSSRGNGQWRCAIELCASAREYEVEDHFDQALAYGEALKAKEVWVINFEVCDEDGKSPELVWPPEGKKKNKYERLGVIHIVHDISWTQAVVHIHGRDEAETVQLK